MKKILGAVSPAYAMMTGEGPIANAMSKGQLGMLPRAMMKGRRKDGSAVSAEEEEQSRMKKGGKVKKMAKGGYVKAADGIAKTGKTKGRMV